MKEYCVAIPELDDTSDSEQSARAYIASKLRNKEPLSEGEIILAAYLIDGEVKPIPSKRARGRQTRSEALRKLDKHESRDMQIANEYDELYSKGESDAAFMTLAEKYGQNFSSIQKAVRRGKVLLNKHNDAVMTFISLVESK